MFSLSTVVLWMIQGHTAAVYLWTQLQADVQTERLLQNRLVFGSVDPLNSDVSAQAGSVLEC